MKEAVPPSDQMRQQACDAESPAEPRTYYKSERGQLEHGQKEILSDIMEKRFAGKEWYSNLEHADDVMRQHGACPQCGQSSCSCSTYEGG